MKTFRYFLLFLFFSISKVWGQDIPRNIVKFNALPLIGGTASFEYERSISKKISLNGSFAFRPKEKLPFKSTFASITDNTAIIDATRLASTAFALEGRFYVNKKASLLNGVYLAPYLKYVKYSGNTEVTYTNNLTSSKEKMPIDANLNAFSAGIALGVQWTFSNHLAVDWRIFGPGYGFSSGSFIGHANNLSKTEQNEILEQVNDFTDKIPVLKVKNEISASGLKSTIDGPWFGIRTGLSIGYSF